MTSKQIAHAFSETGNYFDADAFVSDLILSSHFLDPDDPAAGPDLTMVDPLRKVWNAARLPFRALLTELGLTQSELSRRYVIPLRTVQAWAAGDRVPPDYLRLLLAKAEGYVA